MRRRKKVMKVGNVLVKSVEQIEGIRESGKINTAVLDYVEENVSTKVVKIIQSYTGVVNKMVWRVID